MRELAAAGFQRWREGLPDVVAFGAGLAMAWHFQWQTTDLVWSLWLASLLVGFAMIIWSIFRPAISLGVNIWRDRSFKVAPAPVGAMALGAGAYLIGGLLMLAFFTVHFGMFHYVHSVFLNSFFPIQETKGFGNAALYFEVLARYWWFVPVAVLAERKAFQLQAPVEEKPDTAVTVAAIAARKARNARKPMFGSGGGIMGPYKNVVRLHLLIFFFAFAHYMKFENFIVYAIVYAAYFFPWRLVRAA